MATGNTLKHNIIIFQKINLFEENDSKKKRYCKTKISASNTAWQKNNVLKCVPNLNPGLHENKI